MKLALFLPILVMCSYCAHAQEDQSMHIPVDSANEITVSYRTRNNRLVIPFMINDSVKANLLLDPHCKTLILFGRRYAKKLYNRNKIRPEGSNSGSGPSKNPVTYHNKVTIGPVTAENISIVVVGSSFFNFFTSVNGVIGSDFLADYELIVHKRTETVTIRPLSGSGTLTTRHSRETRFRGLNVSN